LCGSGPADPLARQRGGNFQTRRLTSPCLYVYAGSWHNTFNIVEALSQQMTPTTVKYSLGRMCVALLRLPVNLLGCALISPLNVTHAVCRRVLWPVSGHVPGAFRGDRRRNADGVRFPQLPGAAHCTLRPVAKASCVALACNHFAYILAGAAAPLKQMFTIVLTGHSYAIRGLPMAESLRWQTIPCNPCAT